MADSLNISSNKDPAGAPSAAAAAAAGAAPAQNQPQNPLISIDSPLQDQHHLHSHQHLPPATTGFISPPFETVPAQQQLEAAPASTSSTGTAATIKRPRFNSGQWKVVVSPPAPPAHHQPPPSYQQIPSPTPAQQAQLPLYNATSAAAAVAAGGTASSSDTTSSPSPSPRPGGTAGGLEKQAGEGEPSPTLSGPPAQLRKGKYVSPVWKPNEMLWLARAWRVQYQGGHADVQSPNEGGGGGGGGDQVGVSVMGGGGGGGGGGRGKSRSEKDREVAEYLKRHGVNRDAKTAATKWDNMLGEFRKVYEWERGGERDTVGGKSYFRLSPYERKLHRLPASFDEEVFDELSQFMGSRLRSSSSSSTSPLLAVSPSSSSWSQAMQLQRAAAAAACGGGNLPLSAVGANIMSPGDQHDHHHAGKSAHVPLLGFKSLPPPPPPPPLLRSDDHEISQLPAAAIRGRQLMIASGGESYARGSLLGFHDPQIEIGAMPTSSSSSSKDMRRIGRIRMTWEESVTLWAEEGEHHRGRVKLQGSSFLNADEIMYFDDSMVACSLEAFEDGPFKGFSVDRFVPGQQIKVFGRTSSSPTRLSSAAAAAAASPSELADPTEYYIGCLRVPPTTLPEVFDLSWHIQEPPPDDLRLPLRRDMYRDLPQGKELFFSAADHHLDCRSFTVDILSSLIRSTPSISAPTASSRDSFIGLWDDCINRVVAKFCSVEPVFIRKPSSSQSLQDDHWPHLIGLIRNFCLWRGEETDQVRPEGGGHDLEPSSTIVHKTHWTYGDLPYILGYHAIGYMVTFCALSRSPDQPDRVVRTDLYTVDLSTSGERVKALVPCWRIAGLLALLAARCAAGSNIDLQAAHGGSKVALLPPYYSDFERIDLGNGNIIEMTPSTVTKYYPTKRKWAAVKEIYDYFDNRIPHAEYISMASEAVLALVFKPRGYRSRPTSVDQLIQVLKQVTKALVALHDLSFMHRDLSWDKVLRRCGTDHDQDEWFLSGLEEAVGAPQIHPHGGAGGGGGVGPRQAPEMGRGVYGVKVDVWGVGQLVRTCGLGGGMPKQLRELEKRCLEQNPEQRPTAADCYHHLLQFQSSLSAAAAAAAAAGGAVPGGGGGGGGGYFK
ncbi:hypothetical protein Dimus_000371 [Dionaea muscipula]